jgi:glycosyltransferase involved in cell wall biosynthesis
MAELAVVVPAYNEEQSIADTVATLHEVLGAANIEHEIVVVDDGSIDATAEIARSLDVQFVQHQRNRGYGAALKTGIRVAEAPYIAIVDADGTYPIARLPDLLEIARRTGSEHVIGARRGEQVHDTPGRWVARRVLRVIAFIATGRWIDDLNSGMRVFSRRVALQYWSLYPNGFSFTTTITIATLQSDVDVRFEPIDYMKREGKSHIKPVRDFFRFFGLIMRISFMYSPLRFFVVPGVALLCAAIGLAIWQVAGQGGLADSAVISFLFGGQLLLNGLLAESLARLHLRPQPV